MLSFFLQNKGKNNFICTFLLTFHLAVRMLLLLLLSHFSRVRLCATPQMAAHQAPLSLDSPGKNTGVGCQFLLQCMKGKSESEVAQSRLTLSDPIDCSPPGSSIHGSFQARVLEWGAIAFSVPSILKEQYCIKNAVLSKLILMLTLRENKGKIKH